MPGFKIMIRNKLLISGAALLALAASCRPQEEDRSADIDFTLSSEKAAYTLVNTASEYGLERDLTIGCHANLLMPANIYGHDIAALTDTIRLMAYGENTPTAASGYFLRAVEEFGYAATPLDTALADKAEAEAAADSLADFNGFISVESYLQTLTKKFMSYAVEHSEYAPMAAHGIYGVSYINFDLDSARIIGLTDIIDPASLNSLPQMLHGKARRMTGYIGKTEITALPANNNFYLDADGTIVFVYQPYEVASFAQGIIRIPVEAYRIDGMLTPYGKALLLEE